MAVSISTLGLVGVSLILLDWGLVLLTFRREKEREAERGKEREGSVY